MTRITTDPIGMQPTASIPFGYMADLELGSDVWSQAVVLEKLETNILISGAIMAYTHSIYIPNIYLSYMYLLEVVNFIIRVYGIKYKIFHEQVLIKSSRNETLVLSIMNQKPFFFQFPKTTLNIAKLRRAVANTTL
jgi:hypothetical protein